MNISWLIGGLGVCLIIAVGFVFLEAVYVSGFEEGWRNGFSSRKSIQEEA